MEGIEQLRKEIDVTDKKLVPLLEARMDISGKVAKWKLENNMPVQDAGRENEVLKKVAALCENPAYRAEVMELYGKIMQVSRKLQKKQMDPAFEKSYVQEILAKVRPAVTGGVRVAFQGIAGGYGEEAALRTYPGMRGVPCESFEEVCIALGQGRADYGVLPFENSSTGAIAEVYDLLRQHGVFITGEYKLPVSHLLLGLPGARKEDILEVYSHPEALAQCRDYLHKHRFALVPVSNTAVAARLVAQKGDVRVAAVGSKRAAEEYGLVPLETEGKIQYKEENYTRFVFLACAPEAEQAANKISLLFTLPHVPGSLAALLAELAGAGINLTKIESRPIHNKNWEYYFYADVEGSLLNPDTAAALDRVFAHADYFEILGNYPAQMAERKVCARCSV